MITKFKKDEILFYLSYIILYVSLFIGDVYNIGSMDILARYLRIGSYTLIFISCINLRLKKKDFFRMFAVLMVTLLYGVKTGDLYWSILILLIYNSKKVDIERVYKTSFKNNCNRYKQCFDSLHVWSIARHFNISQYGRAN